jgi:hypothetical protein
MSPFMMGLMLGMTIFSALSLQWAQQELAEIQKHQSTQAKENAEDMAGALEFAMLTENKDTYGEGLSLERARQFSNSTGKTRGDQNFLTTIRQERDSGRFDAEQEKVAITASDDTLLRSQLHRTESAAQLSELAERNNQPVALFDTSTVRDRQVRTCAIRMDSLAEQVYAFYAGRMKFPSTSEFTEMTTKLNFTDTWGQPFGYSVAPDQQSAELSFTTPWGYTQRLKLSLKDDKFGSE